MQANEILEDTEAAIEEMEGEFGPLPVSKLEVRSVSSSVEVLNVRLGMRY